VIDLQKAASDFESAAEHDGTFFGDNWKTRNRNLKRMLIDADTRVSSPECSVEEAASLAGWAKVVGAFSHVCTYISQHGLGSDGYAKAIDSQMHFLALDPVCTLRFPPYLLKARHQSRVRESTVVQFVLLISSSELMSHGFGPDEVAAVQLDMLSERVLSIAKLPTLKDVSKGMMSQFPSNANLVTGVDSAVRVAVDSIVAITNWEASGHETQDLLALSSLANTISAAIMYIENKSNSIGKAVLMYPHGRTLVAAARVAKDRLSRTVQTSELIGRSSPKNHDICVTT
jgi:hypothetical protein